MGSWFLYITFFVYYWIGIWILPLDFQRFIMLFLQHLHSITVILDFTLILCWMTDKLVKKMPKKPMKNQLIIFRLVCFLKGFFKGYLLCLLMTPNNKNKWMEWLFLVDNGRLLKRQKGLITLHVHDVHLSEPQMWVNMSELKVFLVATVRV